MKPSDPQTSCITIRLRMHVSRICFSAVPVTTSSSVDETCRVSKFLPVCRPMTEWHMKKRICSLSAYRGFKIFQSENYFQSQPVLSVSDYSYPRFSVLRLNPVLFSLRLYQRFLVLSLNPVLFSLKIFSKLSVSDLLIPFSLISATQN